MDLVKIQEEINSQLGNAETFKTLVETTFKGLNSVLVKKAMFEGMMRGFKFKDFLEKNIYAIPFGQGYSLVTSIDYSRKIGMRSGVVGKSSPIFVETEKGIVSCTVTIKRLISGYVGDYTATVYFTEYNTGRNQWTTKPHTMIAKVAEMHALRMACPEELSQSYVEEEMEKEIEKPVIDLEQYKVKLEATTTLEELRSVFASLSGEAKKELRPLADALKKKYENI